MTENPMDKARELARPQLPKRFFKKAVPQATENGFTVLLDGRPIRTPATNQVSLANMALAEALAAEWDAQTETIDPATMPLMRLVNTVIDGVRGEMDAVRRDIAGYAGSDLLCYRADEPEGLITAQGEVWDPLVAWAQEALGAPSVLAEGVMPVEQSPELAQSVLAALTDLDHFRLAAMHSLTTLTGSAILALAVLKRHIGAEAAWAAAHVDEDWQIGQWGEDQEAAARRALRWRDVDAAARLLSFE